MPPSSDQETSSFGTSGLPRVTQKQTAVHIPTKKERKNAAAKANSGAAAAMSYNQKMSDSAKPPSPASTPSDSPPESKPGPASQTAVPASGITSPLLGALPPNVFQPSPAQNTNEWARNVPPYSSSPGNLITFSDSPPTQPSSYNDERTTLAGWYQRERSYPTNHPNFPSASPPLPGRRPLSFQMDGHRGLEDHTAQTGIYNNRRASMYSQSSRPASHHPPLPHQAQAHFYGLPAPSFGVNSPPNGVRPGSNGYFCGMDSLYAAKPSGGLNTVTSVVVAGYEGGLQVHGFNKSGTETIAGIEGLRGGVYNAKILPWTLNSSDTTSHPLIAIVVHGPVLTSNGAPVSDDNATLLAGVRATAGGEASDPHQSNGGTLNEIDPVTHFQTRVELYSLATQKHISTLLSLPEVSTTVPIDSSLFSPPQPVGALNLAADSGTLVVSSGTTGESWIFRQTCTEEDKLPVICVGKIWAATQRANARDAASPAELDEVDGMFGGMKLAFSTSKSAIISLRGRWLAYSPSVATKQASLGATVHNMTPNTRIQGLNVYSPPQPPAITCLTDSPDGDKILSQITRFVAQGVVKGAKWAGDQGLQAWNNYWKPGNHVQPSGQITATGVWPGQTGVSPPGYGAQFPPTHGEEIPPSLVVPEPTLVSIIDLEALTTMRNFSKSTTPQPMATFKAPLGCSFLSLAPGGLTLFTASSKGDMYIVWDLMRIMYTKSSLLQNRVNSELSGNHVRQIAIFTRLTVATIVDVLWNLPHGNRIAIITDKSTVHFLDLPLNALIWPPPPRRRNVSVTQPSKTNDSADSSTSRTLTTSAVNVANSLRNFAQPFMTRPRGLSGSSGSPVSAAAMTATIGHGLAFGVSRSVGAATGTLDHLRKPSEARLHLPRGSGVPSIGRIKWLGAQRGDSFAAVVDGIIKIYTIKYKKSKAKHDRGHISIGSRPIDLSLPAIPNLKLAPIVAQAIGLVDEVQEIDAHERAQWILGVLPAVKADRPLSYDTIPQAEIQSSPPWQPFHTDRHSRLYTYDTNPTVSVVTSMQTKPDLAAVPENEQRDTSPSASILLEVQPPAAGSKKKKGKSPTRVIPPAITVTEAPAATDTNEAFTTTENSAWVFGLPIPATKVDTGLPEEDDMSSHAGFPSSDMEYVMTRLTSGAEERIVLTTRPRAHGQRGNGEGGDDEEADWTVVDRAAERV